MSALRRRELLELAEQAGASSPAALALALEAAEQAGWHVRGVQDGDDEPPWSRRYTVTTGRAEIPRALLERAQLTGGWSLVAADGVLTLVVHGRRRAARRDLVSRLRNLRTRGWTYREIAAQLEGEGVLTPRGKTRWGPGNVAWLLRND
jgi:hypothetical protein